MSAGGKWGVFEDTDLHGHVQISCTTNSQITPTSGRAFFILYVYGFVNVILLLVNNFQFFFQRVFHGNALSHQYSKILNGLFKFFVTNEYIQPIVSLDNITKKIRHDNVGDYALYNQDITWKYGASHARGTHI